MNKKLNIGLDYDDTCTADITGWLAFVEMMRARGHSIYITTMRYPSEISNNINPAMNIPEELIQAVNKIIPTSRQAKRKVCEILGIKIDVWIDDNPEAVYKSASEIWPVINPEGKTV